MKALRQGDTDDIQKLNVMRLATQVNVMKDPEEYKEMAQLGSCANSLARRKILLVISNSRQLADNLAKIFGEVSLYKKALNAALLQQTATRTSLCCSGDLSACPSSRRRKPDS